MTTDIEALKARTFEFDRYINGVLMAEGVTVELQSTFEEATKVAAKIASRGPHGEVPVLVLRPALDQLSARIHELKGALREEWADAVVQKCAEFAKSIIISDARTKLPKGEKKRTPEELAALVYNSLVNMKSRENAALSGGDEK